MKRRHLLRLLFSLFGVLVPSLAPGADYHVGPGQDYASIGAVPWENLAAGDRVYIHWRNESYCEKWVIGRSGTAEAPILVSGVTGPQGQLPVVDGRNATTRPALDYWNENRGLVKIGGSSIPNTAVPAYIIVENLELRSARPPYTFTDDSGNAQTYSSNAASFYVEIGQHLTLRNCIIRDSGNGIFIGANNGQTQDILIEGNAIYDNGIEGSYYEHNTYTAAIGITYQYNFMGALREEAGGNNLKDRSAGLVVRYNWIENGNRQLDLVDGEDTDVIVNDPRYRQTFVYGNVLKEENDQGNSQIVHYGGDSGNTSIYRKGTLYFYNNTVISTRAGNTTLLRLSTNDEFADVFNNMIYQTAAGSNMAMLDSSGRLQIRHNWLKAGWEGSHDTLIGTIIDDGSSILGDETTPPGFVDFGSNDYHLGGDSPAVDMGIALESTLQVNHPLDFQYRYHQGGEPRPDDGFLDIGAFERYQPVKGDLNGDGVLGLTDCILSLQVVAGKQPALDLQEGVDVDEDAKVGLAEALYCLQQLAKGRN